MVSGLFEGKGVSTSRVSPPGLPLAHGCGYVGRQICITAPRDTVLMPCLHFLYCKGCVAQHRLNQNLCPVCRTGISGELIVHLQQ